ncbi:MAG: hypothetical protein AB7P17_13270 [Nitrospirales bacterium]|nr:hypothetical protein [Nitrospirales bacterium]
MKLRCKKILALLLSIVLVLLMGTMHISLASHVIEHAHHTGTTHSTGICAWMCMAAQSISADSPTLKQAFLPMGLAEEPVFSSIIDQYTFLLPSRGPPFYPAL